MEDIVCLCLSAGFVWRAGVMLLVFCGCLMVKTVICFPSVALIATYVYKILVYTSGMTGAEE